MTNTEFNRRMNKSRLSAGWSHNTSHYRFERQHDSRAPFVESHGTTGFASALIGVLCFFALILIALFAGAY